MKRKIFLIIFAIILITNNTSYGNEEIREYINQEETEKVISEIEKIDSIDIELDSIFDEALSGKVNKSLILNLAGKILGKELSQSLKMIISILIIVIVHSILKAVSENLGNDETGKIGYFVQLILLVTVLAKVYLKIIEQVKTTIEELSTIAYTLIPIYMSLITATGNITTGATAQSIILIAINLITLFINQILLPILIIATAIGITSSISDEIHMNKLSKYMKSITIWFLCIFLTIFTCLLSMETSLGKGVDDVTLKTGKTIVSSTIPIVGKILGDSVESVLSCTNVVKNAIGVFGTIIVVLIGLAPIIRIGIVTLFFYLISGVAEIIADKKIVYVLEQMGDSCKVLLASVSSIVMMLVIGFTLTLKIGT